VIGSFSVYVVTYGFITRVHMNSTCTVYALDLRGARFFIDFGTFVLRMVLWVKYDAVSSVFLIKNLYNLLHTGAQVTIDMPPVIISCLFV
jgi:hypothetical protein